MRDFSGVRESRWLEENNSVSEKHLWGLQTQDPGQINTKKIKRKIMEYLSPNSSPCMLHVCTRVCMHSCALVFEEQMLIWCVFLSYSPFYSFETVSFTEPELEQFGSRSAGQWAAKIHLSLQYQCWKNKYGLLHLIFYVVFWTLKPISCSYNKHFTKWAISSLPPPIYFLKPY